jgi:hypothetical protein
LYIYARKGLLRLSRLFVEYVWRNHLVISVLQYPLFCIAKAPVLHGKSAYIVTQNRLFWKTKAAVLFCVVIFIEFWLCVDGFIYMYIWASGIGIFGILKLWFVLVRALIWV